MTTILVDSTCDLTPEQAKRLGVVMLSLKVNFGMEAYADKTEITNAQFYEKLEQCDELPTTSLLSVGDFLEEYEKHESDILVLTLASSLSGTYQSAMTAKEQCGRENIHVVDSRSVAIGMALLLDQAVILRDRGLGASAIADALGKLIPRLRVYAMVDTLKYLVKGGRLTGVAGALGGLLSLKPLVALEDGKVVSLKKARGVKCAMKELVELCSERDPSLPICFTHAKNATLAVQLATTLCPDEKHDIYELGSVVGAHVGPGAVGVAYFTK